MSASPGTDRPARVRDPDRGDKILSAAAQLFATQGFHPVSLADIGREAGIVGSGIYRHFDNKVAVLVALLDRAMADLVQTTDRVLARQLPAEQAMAALIETQVDFCLQHRLAVQLYRTELTAIGAEDARRLRRLQRRYNEEWVGALVDLRPELGEVNARALVYAAVASIQSSVTYDSGLDRDRQAALLHAVAARCLSTELSS